MNKNINIYKNIIEKKYKENIRSNIIKNYLIFNTEKKYILNVKKKNYINNNINNNITSLKKTPKNSKNIILLNNKLIKLDNLNEIKIFSNINKELLTDIKNFFIDCMYPNLNLNYFTSELLLENKIFIKIPKNLNFKKHINIININKKELNNKNQKIYLIIEENSKVDVLNYFIVKNKNLSNNININIFLKKNSFLNYKIINSNKKINNNNTSIYVKQLKDSNLQFTEMSIGKTNLNSNKIFFLLGKNSDLNKKAGYSLNSKIKCNILCKINHYENDSKSKILIKATTNENSEFKFKGNIEVSINTEKTQSNLTCKGVMLAKKGSIELIPELSINNNNIICSHAATIGYIDKNIITYMKSRGISENECINTLKKIFFYDISHNEKILSKLINKI